MELSRRIGWINFLDLNRPGGLKPSLPAVNLLMIWSALSASALTDSSPALTAEAIFYSLRLSIPEERMVAHQLCRLATRLTHERTCLGSFMFESRSFYIIVGALPCSGGLWGGLA